MLRRWLPIIGKVFLTGFLVWHFSVVTVSSMPDRSEFSWVKTIRADVLPYTDPYAFYLSQWQSWGMFSEASVARVFTHQMEKWNAQTNTWDIAEDLSYHALPLFFGAHETALLRTIEQENLWPSRERYLQLKCVDLGLPPGTWVRMGYKYYDQPPLDQSLTPEQWTQWQPTWLPWEDTHLTKCPDPTTPMSTWSIPQALSAS